MTVSEPTSAHAALLEDFRAGKRIALARVISIVENERPGFQEILHELHGSLGRAQRIGITGPPGAGKSTLTGALAAVYRERGERVAIIAVDPSSPFTGGALLGDRIRMNDIALDPGIFIRSMAARGSLGGLATTTKEVADVMDAFGFDRILIETVGVGQSELDIARTADTTLVVLVPEAGDSIQAMKAGLMEISDIFTINKADRPGAERLAREIEMMLHLRTGQGRVRTPAHHGVDLDAIRARKEARQSAATGEDAAGESAAAAPTEDRWAIPVLRTVAQDGEGVEELADTLVRHFAWLEASGELGHRRAERVAERVREAVERRLKQIAWVEGEGEAILEEALPALRDGTETPYEVSARIVRAITG